MLLNNLKKESSPKKKQDIKMLAIAAGAVLLMIGLLFWLFSGSSEDKSKEVVIQPVSQTNTEIKQHKPPLLNEKTLASMSQDEVISEKVVIGENPFVAEDQGDGNDTINVVSEDVKPSSKFNQEAIDKFSAKDTAPVQNRYENNNLKSTNSLFTSFDDMKSYLNEIKKDIKIGSNSFEYDNKIYKQGDIFNSLDVVEISDVFIRFSNVDWEYTLRFLGDR